MNKLIFLIFIFTLNIQTVFATVDEVDTAFFQSDELPKSILIDQNSAPKFQKKLDIMNYFGVQKEVPPTEILMSYDKKQTYTDFIKIKKYFDPKLEFEKYISTDSDKITLFQDRDDKQIVDQVLSFAQNEQNENHQKSLVGLKVAIDPGHMGGDFWDRETGKYVQINSSRVSEGDMAVVTSVLVAQKLQSLGAETMITHEYLGPVTSLDYQKFELKPFATDQFYKEADQPWFENILQQSDDLSVLYNLFLNHATTKKIFSENFRNYLYIFKADLQARAEKINAFRPDVTLIVHFDASEINKLQNSVQGVKTYVPGGILGSELPTQKYRYQYLTHMLNSKRWNESVSLSEQLAKSISTKMQIPVEKNPDLSREFYVKDGVFSRNLNLNRENQFGLVSYLECLHYDYSPEFYRLAKTDKSIKVGQTLIHYSSRLELMSEAIVEGLQNYLAL